MERRGRHKLENWSKHLASQYGPRTPRENGTMSPWRVPRPMPRAIGADSREGLGVPGGIFWSPRGKLPKSGVEAGEE